MAQIDFDRINRILTLAGLQSVDLSRLFLSLFLCLSLSLSLYLRTLSLYLTFFLSLSLSLSIYLRTFLLSFSLSLQIPVSDSQPHTALKLALKVSAPSLLGTSNAEISQWLAVSKELSESPKESPRLLKTLNSFLLTRSFLVGNTLTIADLAVFEPLANLSLVAYPEVNRWSLFVRSRCQNNFSHVVPPTIFPVIKKQAVAPPSASAPTTEPTKTESEPVKTESKEESKKEEKQAKKEKSKKEKSVETKTETPSASTSSEESELDPSKLDFRVGFVIKCWDHPEADKLLCEDVDIGEATGPRKIASGLRAHYSASELEGKKVIVLANLKDRTMVGFKSQVTFLHLTSSF